MTVHFRWILNLLQTSDPLFPTGSYAHSFGLEGMVELGLVKDESTLLAFLRTSVIPTLQNVELPFVRLVYGAALQDNVEKVLELDEFYGAMKTSMEARLASSRIGSQRLRMLLQLHSDPLLQTLEARRTEGRFSSHSNTIISVSMARSGVPLEAVLHTCFYLTIAAYLSASLKLMRIGQNSCQVLLSKLMEESEQVIALSHEVTLADAGWFSPHLDIAASRHERAFTRLFIS